jgi:hypothetical protein
MKLITKLQSLWFFGLIVFGIGVLLELNNKELNLSTLIVFTIYCVLYFIASSQNDQKSKQFKDRSS